MSRTVGLSLLRYPLLPSSKPGLDSPEHRSRERPSECAQTKPRGASSSGYGWRKERPYQAKRGYPVGYPSYRPILGEDASNAIPDGTGPNYRDRE